MHNGITIHNNSMPLVEFQGLRVVTFAMVDAAHQRPDGTAAATFRRHRHRFTENRHFFDLSDDVLHRQTFAGLFPASTVDWGSTGYLDRGHQTYRQKSNQFSQGYETPRQKMNSAIRGKITLITESGFAQVGNLSKLDMRSRLAGGTTARKKGEDNGPALWCCLDQNQPFGSILEQSTNLPKSLDSGSWHNLTSPETSPFSQVMPALPKYKTTITATIHISVFNILRDLLGSQSFDFFRCSALSLRPQASSTQAEKLAVGLSVFSRSTLVSMLSINSLGNRIPLYVDLPFLFPVVISKPMASDIGVYTKYNMHGIKKRVDLFTHHELILFTHLIHRCCTNSEARQCGDTNRASDHNDSQRIEVAMRNHTTAPQRFTFLFLAVVRANPQAHPHREQIAAASEREARSLLVGRFVLVFAGRLPALGVTHG